MNLDHEVMKILKGYRYAASYFTIIKYGIGGGLFFKGKRKFKSRGAFQSSVLLKTEDSQPLSLFLRIPY